jgi:hypothetical protein
MDKSLLPFVKNRMKSARSTRYIRMLGPRIKSKSRDSTRGSSHSTTNRKALVPEFHTSQSRTSTARLTDFKSRSTLGL